MSPKPAALDAEHVASPATPTELQQRASSPYYSIWMAANAGSGKTKVLVDRVLRLLLSGVPAGHILCITYTNAAAAEMRSRVVKRAREWVAADSASLTEQLAALTGNAPDAATCLQARQLFIQILDGSPGLRIQTIHSLCQTLLSQFPHEAGISPFFRLMDEQEAGILAGQARQAVMAQAYREPEGGLASAIDTLIELVSEYSFTSLIDAIRAKRRAYHRVMLYHESALALIEQLYARAGFAGETTEVDIIRDYLEWHDPHYRDWLRQCAAAIRERGAKSEVPIMDALLTELAKGEVLEAGHHAARHSGILTKEGKQRRTFPTKATQRALPEMAAGIQRFAEKCAAYLETWHRFQATRLSAATLCVAEAFFRHYEGLKHRTGGLDYDDLIDKTLILLHDPDVAPWVLYKLDGQIDHLLIDEAQDTSHAQWEITARLCEEFFAGQGAQSLARRLFVVGDRKQSIYSFQGAAPAAFSRQHARYRHEAQEVSHPFATVPMRTSFRSTPAVLHFVDAVCADEQVSRAVGGEEEAITHQPYRQQSGGGVVLYPLVTSPRREPSQPWSYVHERTSPDIPKYKLAAELAGAIAGWLASRRILPSTGKAIRPQDILILLQRRGALAEPLTRALQYQGVPVAGQDRLVLTSHVAVKDLLALAGFLLDSHDDMALAALLTSPLYNMDYDRLTRLCAGRAKAETVWQRLQADAESSSIVEELKALQREARERTPHSLFSDILFAHGGLYRFTARMGEGVRDVLQSFLYECARYESSEAAISLQGLLAWLSHHQGEIKRDMEEGGGEVRIMTVHGAKGLEAPVVVLPDTCSKPDDLRKESLLVHEDEGEAPLLLSLQGGKEKQSEIFHEAYEQRAQEMREESLRLLYVALTRARDELHIFGMLTAGHSNMPSGCWYHYMQQAMDWLEIAEQEDGRRCFGMISESAEASQGDEAMSSGEAEERVPTHWLRRPDAVPTARVFEAASTLSAEQPPALILSSESDGEELVTHSPAQTTEDRLSATERGTLIHRCLEYQTGQHYAVFLAQVPSLLSRWYPDLGEDQRQDILDELAAFGADDEIRGWLEAEALAELPVIGALRDGTYVTGQIDRLITGAQRLVVLDIKTGQAPAQASLVPATYKRQMQAYGKILARLYPHHRIDSALLYARPAPTLMWLCIV